MKINNKLPRISLFVATFVLLSAPIGISIGHLIQDPDTANAAFEALSISPDKGSVIGGEEVTITGVDLDEAEEVEIVQLAAGTGHNLALSSKGKIYAWGSNVSGQLGNGTNDSSSTPVEVDMSGVMKGKDIVAIETRYNNSFALDSDGKLYGWGNNVNGILGNGSTDHTNLPVAVDTSGVLNGKKIVQVASSQNHTIVLDDEGQIYAWGSNNAGRMGPGAIYSTVPVKIQQTGNLLEGKEIILVEAGYWHSYAVDSNSNIYAWGWNDNGQLGDGVTGAGGSYAPVQVVNTGVLSGKSIVQISAGKDFTMVLDTDGRTYGWGYNAAGQIGNGEGGTGVKTSVPVATDNSGVLKNISLTQISAGWYHTMALGSDNQIYLWGYDYYGQMGDDEIRAHQYYPTTPDTTGVLKDKTFIQVESGIYHSMALDYEGKVYAWGYNYAGQIADGTTTDAYLPTGPVDFSAFAIEPEISVTIDGLECTNVTIISSDTITCITPAHISGTVDVVVGNGRTESILPSSYTYVDVGVPNTGAK
ncbi:MAG: IPT/TIG domain-containing protein [Candidatus Saccharimonadales bacterium]